MNVRAALTNLARTVRAGRWQDLAHEAWARWHGLDLEPAEAMCLGLLPSGKGYMDSGGADLAVVLRALALPRHLAVLDLGCGKGGALITLARYFARADGVEYSAHLAEIARANLGKLRLTNAAVICGDASDFTALDSYAVIYLFNPFDDTVLSKVVRNLTDSLRRSPRELTVIYAHPKHDVVILRADFTCTRVFTHAIKPINIYRSARP